MSAPVATAAAAVLLALAATGCTLSEFVKSDSDDSPGVSPDAAVDSAGPAPTNVCQSGLELPRACGACVAQHCCEQASACKDGACGSDIDWPLSPLAEVSDNFDALARCMQEYCDSEDTCDVSWGCVGKYRWPALREEHPFNMRMFNFADANETGLAGVTVKLCEASDPTCSEDSGFVSMGRTDSAGNADFIAPRGFNGYFLHEGGAAMPGVISWNRPVYNVVDGFTHQAFLPSSVSGLAVQLRLHSKVEDPFDPERGHLIIRIQSCLPLRYLDTIDPGGRAKDVKFTFGPSQGATRIYYVNDQATVDLNQDRTSIRGYAGAFEVTATNVSVTAEHAVTGKQVATGVVSIRAGSIGYMYLMPNAVR
jgi:hypothetical protein